MHRQILVIILLQMSSFGYAQVNDISKRSEFHLMNTDTSQINNYQVIRRISANEVIIRQSEEKLKLNDEKTIFNNSWKISPTLKSARSRDKVSNKFLIRVLNYEKLHNQLKILGIKVIGFDEKFQALSIDASWKVVEEQLLTNNDVIYIELLNRPVKEETSIRSHDIGLNGIEYIHSNYPEINGNDITVSVKERTIIQNDIDVIGRTFLTEKSDTITSLHATEMATLIAGAGNSFYSGRGVALGTSLTSANFNSLMPEDELYYSLNNISIQNHSYGVSIENYYGIESLAFDQLVFYNPNLLHVFSSGNSGSSTSDQGSYAGIDGFANITGSFKQSKNSLVIAAVDTILTSYVLSSKGPAYDGRVKPELSAFGGEGTSEAAALVSGSAALIQDHFYASKIRIPESSIVKALLIAGSDDIGEAGIDYITGYGNLNIINSLEILNKDQFFEGSINENSSVTYTITLPENVNQVKIALTWIDPPANTGDYKALVNDLNLRLVNTSTGEEWAPWVLNPSPDSAKLMEHAIRGLDTLNNVEFITLDLPESGQYLLKVLSNSLDGDNQKFSLAYYYSIDNVFRWIYPVKISSIEANSSSYLRWNSTYQGEIGSLEINYGDNNWQLILSQVDIDKNYTKINFPDTSTIAIIKMTIGTSQYLSDTFTISPLIKPIVGFNCDEDAMIYWSSLPNINKYLLEGLGDNYKEVISISADTMYIINKSINIENNYSVRPQLGPNKFGLASKSIDYTDQAAGCYIKRFFASINESGIGEIQLELGSDYNVLDVKLEKISPDLISSVHDFDNISLLDYKFIDDNNKDGINYYQSSVLLTDGRMIKSDSISLVYLNELQAIVFPNPISKYQPLNVITDSQDPLFQVLDTSGKVVYQTEFSGTSDLVYLDEIVAGLYLYRLSSEQEVIATGRIILID